MNGLIEPSNFETRVNNEHGVTNHIAHKPGDTVQQRINLLGVGHKMQDLPEELWHKSFKYYVKEDPNRKGGPNLRIIRLDPDKPSPTVTGYIFNKFVHPTEHRFITVREAARLQGFPDQVKFYGSLTSTQMQVGNAVPVNLAKAVFTSLLDVVQKTNLMKSELDALSLFSGAGGMDIGADLASSAQTSISTKLAIDVWEDACKTLQNYYGPHGKVIKQDITKITNPLDFWTRNTNLSTTPDIIYGGPPCQAFSQAGKQKGTEDDRGRLIFEFLRFVEVLQPMFFILENVSNLKGVGQGKLYQQLLENMSFNKTEVKYNIVKGVLTAANYGTPQLRRRLIIIGCRSDLGNILLPESTHYSQPSFFTKRYVTVREAFEGLPEVQFIK